jgi:hypothetical protein
MKKILTIAATAGLLSSVAGAAQALPINAPGTVTQSCNVTSVNNGTLTENATPATSLTTGTGAGVGLVTVVCNTDTSVLTLAGGTHILPTQTSIPTVSFGFAPGGTGIYSTVKSGIVSPPAGDMTAASGDIAHVTSTVMATGGKLLKAGTYTTVINATVAP